jgi:hypothetical protein
VDTPSASRPQRGILLAGLGALLALSILAWVAIASDESPIEYYKVLDQQTLGLHVHSGQRDWCRIDLFVETQTEVRAGIVCMNLLFFIAGPAIAENREIVVKLDGPLGARTVHNRDGPALPTERPGPFFGELIEVTARQ